MHYGCIPGYESRYSLFQRWTESAFAKETKYAMVLYTASKIAILSQATQKSVLSGQNQEKWIITQTTAKCAFDFFHKTDNFKKHN